MLHPAVNNVFGLCFSQKNDSQINIPRTRDVEWSGNSDFNLGQFLKLLVLLSVMLTIAFMNKISQDKILSEDWMHLDGFTCSRGRHFEQPLKFR